MRILRSSRTIAHAADLAGAVRRGDTRAALGSALRLAGRLARLTLWLAFTLVGVAAYALNFFLRAAGPAPKRRTAAPASWTPVHKGGDGYLYDECGNYLGHEREYITPIL